MLNRNTLTPSHIAWKNIGNQTLTTGCHQIYAIFFENESVDTIYSCSWRKP